MPSPSSSLWSEDPSEMGTPVWTWSRTEALEEPKLFTEVHMIFTSWCSTPAAIRELFIFEHQSHQACIETFCDACECESVSANPELFGTNRPPSKSDPHLWMRVPSLKSLNIIGKRPGKEEWHLRCASHEGQGSKVQGGGRGSPHLHFKQRGRRGNWEGNKEDVFSWGEKYCYRGIGLAINENNAMKQVKRSLQLQKIRVSTARETANTVVQCLPFFTVYIVQYRLNEWRNLGEIYPQR